jgi:phosphatidylinositol alpha-mannosyltransferase
MAVLAVLAVRKIGFHHVTSALLGTNFALVTAGLAVMCASMVLRAVSWHAALRAGLPGIPIRLREAMRALFIGVLISSVLPASLGEPSRALVVVRRSRRGWETLPVVLGTLMSQTLLNVAALIVLGAVTLASVDLFSDDRAVLAAGAAGAALALIVVLVAPSLLGHARQNSWTRHLYTLATRLRSGLAVFRHPGLAAVAIGGQWSAWLLQCAAVYVLLASMHLAHVTGFAGAVAVVFAVNVTLLLPLTPGDVGVFQAATAAVLHAGWQVPFSSGVAFGVVLQAVELVAALVMGTPALLLEGLSWQQLTQRPPAETPVELPAPDDPRPESSVRHES